MASMHPALRTLPLLLLLAACGATKPPAADEPAQASAAASKEAAGKDAEEGGDVVHLEAEQVRKLGLQANALQATQYRDELEGYAQVWSHEAIAQGAAELAAAEAAQKQSSAAVARMQKLADTPGAFPADALEAAQRQLGADQAALLLAGRKLSALLGDHAPLSGEGTRLAEIASGHAKLVRVTFPIGTHLAALPTNIRLLPLDAEPADKGWTSSLVWPAPADSSVPGRSLWAVVTSTAAPVEGDRLAARAPQGAPLAGVLVPDAAVVLSDNKLWCFVEQEAGLYRKKAITADHPVAGGFVVTEGLETGERVVTHGAGLLLARATNAGGAEE